MDIFIFLSKFIPALIYPSGFIFICLFLALCFSKSKNWRSVFLIMAFLTIFICGNKLPGAWLTRSLESAYPPFTEDRKAGAIVILGGCTATKAYPRQMVEINGAGDRILYGANLYRKGLGTYLLVGGSYIDWLDGFSASEEEKISSPASEMAQLAVDMGVPSNKIIVQNRSLNTYEEAVEDAKILKEFKIDEIILVTSASHMKRSVGVFEAQGLKVIPAPTDYKFSDEDWKNILAINSKNFYTYIIPSTSNLSGFESALKEYIGYFTYLIKGWI